MKLLVHFLAGNVENERGLRGLMFGPTVVEGEDFREAMYNFFIDEVAKEYRDKLSSMYGYIDWFHTRFLTELGELSGNRFTAIPVGVTPLYADSGLKGIGTLRLTYAEK